MEGSNQTWVYNPRSWSWAQKPQDGTTTGETDNLERTWWRQWPAGQSLSDMDFHFLPDKFNEWLKRGEEDIMRSRTIDIRSEWVNVWDCGKEEQERAAPQVARSVVDHCTAHSDIQQLCHHWLVGGVLVVSQQFLSSCSQSLGLDEEKLRSRTSLHLYS